MTITPYFIIVLLVLLAKLIWSRRKFYWLSWQLPGPIALPIIGNALYFRCKDEDVFEKAIALITNYPSPLRFWFGPKFSIMISDVEHAEKVMSSMKFATKDDLYRFIKVFNGEGLITGSGAKWKHDRKLMSPLFLKKNIETYFPFMTKHTNHMIDILNTLVDKPTFDIEPYLQRCASDIVNASIVGMKTNAQDGHLDKFLKAVSKMYAIVHVRIVKVWLQIEWIFHMTHYNKLQTEGREFIHSYMRKAIENSRTKSDKTISSFLDKMLKLQSNHDDYATDEELVHHMTTLYSASEDTVMIVCSFTLVLLGMYPNIQNKIAEELQEHLRGRDLELKDVEKLVYLDMVVKDVLRLFPIAPFIMRTTLEECQIGKYQIPKGCSVVVCIHYIHRDPKHWSRPNEFYPEHFLPEAVNGRHPYAYMPFSAGPRACLGKAYAYLAIKVMLSSILKKYIVEADGTLQEIKLKTDISVRFKDDCYPIRIKKRY